MRTVRGEEKDVNILTTLTIGCAVAFAVAACAVPSGATQGRTSYESLQGAQASSADGSLRNMGFTDVDSFDSGSTNYTIWYNSGSKECLQMTVANGAVVDVSDIGTHPQCSIGGASATSGNSDDVAWFNRLHGASDEGAERQMRLNGFELVDTFGSGRDGNGSVWYNRSTRQCVQMIVVNGRVDSALDIGQHPRCG